MPHPITPDSKRLKEWLQSYAEKEAAVQCSLEQATRAANKTLNRHLRGQNAIYNAFESVPSSVNLFDRLIAPPPPLAPRRPASAVGDLQPLFPRRPGRASSSSMT